MKDVKVNNVIYSSVPSVELPLSSGTGYAQFFDISDTTATADKILEGYGAYSSSGTWMSGTAKEGGYEFVEQLYSASFNLADDTSFSSWSASTTAGSILATATLSSNKFVADMENYEYLLWWKMWIKCEHTEDATLKAIPIWEGTNAVQSIFRRPNSLATIKSGTKAGNTCVTQTSAPLMIYYNTNGVETYTYANTYGIYGTVQTATFSNATSLNPTVTPKRPVINARCNSSYFATGRKANIDAENSTFYMTCDLYRMPLTSYGQTAVYDGLIETYTSHN